MPESAWSLQLSQFRKAVGYYLGYGRGAIAAWTDEQLEDIDDCIDSGLRQFYSPPILPGETRVHQWTFLRPTTTLVTTASDSEQNLPDDVAGIVGDITYDADNWQRSIRSTSEEMIRRFQAGAGDMTGPPMYYCTAPVTSSGISGQRLKIIFSPTPDAAYTLSYRYVWTMPKLADDRPFPMGGPFHADTIQQSCVAVAEQRKNDQVGIEYQRFIERLTKSVSMDRDLLPDTLGVGTDNSERRWFEPVNTSGTTFEGVMY